MTAGAGPVPFIRLSWRQRVLKRTFDLAAAGVGLLLLAWAVPLLVVLAARSTGARGIFRQERVGREGRPFLILKLRTMRPSAVMTTTVTVADDPRVTRFGAFLRRTKLDELPQLVNVLLGTMSLVGPRPDVAQFVEIEGPLARSILSVRPGITGPATIAFRREEDLLAAQDDPEAYNRDVLVPAKARLNYAYVRDWTLRGDVRYILMTLRGATIEFDEPKVEPAR